MALISHQICVQGPRALELLGESSTSCVREELLESREPSGWGCLHSARAGLGDPQLWDVHREQRHQPGPGAAGLWCGPNSSWFGLNPPPRSFQQLQLLLQDTPMALWHHPLSPGTGRGFGSTLGSLWGD